MDSDRITPTTFTMFENTERCIVRNTERLYFHPRTGELILGVEHVRTPRPNRKHLANLPRVSYHRRVNASLTNGAYCLIAENVVFRDSNGLIDTAKPEFKPTKQWKTVWHSKHDQRS